MRYSLKTLLNSMVALALVVANTSTLAAPSQDDVLLGKRLFLRCAACHAVWLQAPAKVGPNLQGIVERKTGSVARYSYSPAMRQANLVWNEAALDRWLQSPESVVPGTTIGFAGLPELGYRKALIPYLKKPSP